MATLSKCKATSKDSLVDSMKAILVATSIFGQMGRLIKTILLGFQQTPALFMAHRIQLDQRPLMYNISKTLSRKFLWTHMASIILRRMKIA